MLVRRIGTVLVGALVGLSLVVVASPAQAGPGSLSGPAGLSVEAAYAAMAAETTTAAAAAAGTTATGAAGAAALTTAEAASGIGFASGLANTAGVAVLSVAGWFGGDWLVNKIGGLLGGPSYPPGFQVTDPSPYFIPVSGTGQFGMTTTGASVTIKTAARPAGGSLGWYSQYNSQRCGNGQDIQTGVTATADTTAGGVRTVTWGATPSVGCTAAKGGLAGIRIVIQDLTNTWGLTDNNRVDITYWLPGQGSQAPPAVDPMSGTIVQTITCRNAAGDVVTRTQSTPVILTEGTKYAVGNLMCPAGYVTTSGKADWTPSTPGAGTQTVIPTTPTDPGTQSIPSEYPRCLVETCTLELFRISPLPVTSCGAYAVGCPQWYTDPGRDSSYECHFGPYVVALDRCSIYRKPGETTPNTDTTTAGPVYQPFPPLSPSPAPAPAPDTSGGQSCWGGGWSALANPVEWVLTPVKCALAWAFVPTKTQTLVTDITTTIQTKTPVPQIGSVAAALQPPELGTACLRLSLPVSFVIGHDVPMLDSCTWSDPVSQMLHEHRALLAAAVWVACASPLLWWAWRQYAPGATGAA